MKQANVMVAGALVVAAVTAAGGYWWGSQSADGISSPDKGRPGGVESARKIFYYRNPMGLPDTSQVRRKDAMGMDYVPVYEGEEDPGSGPSTSSGQIRISIDKVQKL